MIRAECLPPLGDGEFYLHQLIGMKVLMEDKDSSLGIITEIIETGANDVYIVRNQDGSELLLPAIDPVIKDIDIEQNVIRVRLLPGLLPENKNLAN